MTETPRDATREDRIRLVRIQAFFENAKGNPIALVVTGLFFVLLMYGEGGPRSLLLSWTLALFVVSGGVYLFDRYVGKVGLSLENAQRLFGWRCILGCVIACVFGATVLLLPQDSARTAYCFVFIITMSVAAAGYLAYATVYWYCLLVNLFSMFPLSAYCFYRYFLDGEAFFLLMGLASVLWQLIFSTKAYRISKSVIGEIIARERLRDEMAERRVVEEALGASEARSKRLATMLRLICDNVPDMIWAKDLEGRYLFVNRAFSERLLKATSTDEPLGKTFGFFVERERNAHADDPEWYTLGEYSEDVDRHVLGREEPTEYEESGHVCGTFAFLEVNQARLIDDRGELIGTVGCARDITERKASEGVVERLAYYDALTELPNRALLNDRMHQALAQAKRDRGRLAVLFVDLDQLKPVNDTYGHDVGDLLLREVAMRLREVVQREADTVARLGGDEFVVLLQRVNREQDAATVAAKILESLNASFKLQGEEIRISASIGIAVFPYHGEDHGQLLKHADAAMYAAKRGGRNSYCFFDETMSGQ